MKPKILLAVLVVVVVSVGGCISKEPSLNSIVSYWYSINSFTAHEEVKIGNLTFESYVNFTKPDKISRADYVNGSPLQEVTIENGIQKIVTANGTFTLNATLDDVNALDPFASILNNLDSFNITKRGNSLILTPKTKELPSYEVELNEKLPRKITVKQGGIVIIVEYKMTSQSARK